MSIKLKLTSMIIAFVLVVSMLLVGVFAAVNIQLQIGGTVNFVVNETEVYLNKVTLKNIVAETGNGYQAEESVLDNYSNLYIQSNTSLTYQMSPYFQDRQWKLTLI